MFSRHSQDCVRVTVRNLDSDAKKQLIQESHMVPRRKALLSLNSVLEFLTKIQPPPSPPPKYVGIFIYTLEILFRKQNGVLSRTKQNLNFYSICCRTIFTACQRSCGKVMFSQVGVCLSTDRQV